MPRFTPHVPGPSNEFRRATAGLSSTSAPTVGTLYADGSQIRLPLFFKGSPVTSGRYELPVKSPTASVKALPRLPGVAGPQSSHSQKGVKPVPDLMNHCHGGCREPTTASAHLESLVPNFRL